MVQAPNLMGGTSGVRKGAWTKFEDDLLKACVHLYGEGKWHLVPQRAGLKRCRKSCRLRWLNYLRPNLKRGDFGEDEVDLIIRMHKLLGNRWSLIAGRIPGRTPNDVKNYWNTYMRRKVESQKKHNNVKQLEAEIVTTHQVIKPLPRTFTKASPWLQEKLITSDQSGSQVGINEAGAASSGLSNWWETLSNDMENNTYNNTCFFGVGDGVHELWNEEITSNAYDFLTEGKTWSDYFVDTNCG